MNSLSLSPSPDAKEHQLHHQNAYNHDDLLIDYPLILPNQSPTTNGLGLKRPRSFEPPITINENNPPPPAVSVLHDQAIVAPNLEKGDPNQPRPKGRPKGSKNKPKTQPTIKTYMLEILHGFDIVDVVHNFSQAQNAGVHIISGSGKVKNVTIRNPMSEEPAISLPGIHDLTSINGAHVGAANMRNPLTEGSYSHFSAQTSYMMIYLTTPSGFVRGGQVTGKLVAASIVMLNVSTFDDYGFYRVPIEPNQNQGQRICICDGSSTGRGSDLGQDSGPSSGPIANVTDGLNGDPRVTSPKRCYLGDV